MKLFSLLHSLLVLICAPLLTLLVSLLVLIWVGLFRRPSDEAHVFVRYWGQVVCAISGVRVVVEGTENLQPDRPYIFAANHQSQYDIITIQAYLLFNFRWLAKKELFKVPIWGRAMKITGYIPIDRSHGRQAVKSLEQAAKRIGEGTSVIIFPEGTRSRDGKLQAFKTGGMMLAIKSGVELVPMAILGTYDILPKGRFTLHPGKVRIRIGKPIATRDFTTQQKHELATLLHSEITTLLSQKEME